MGISLGEISAAVRADTTIFQRDLMNARNIGNNFSGQFSRISDSLKGVFNNLGGNIGKVFSNLGETFKATGEILKNIGSGMQQLGGNMTKYLTVPIAGAGTAIFKLGKDFEKELSKVVGLVGISQKQINEWGKEILTLAPQLGKAPKELAEALFFVTSAGIKGAEAMDVLKMSGKASAAGLGETATIADLVTSAMNAYGKENLSAAKATDIVAMAVRQGKAEAAELASSMGAVLPIASEMGVSFDQVAAAQAAMTRTGTPATEAATQLKAILAGMIKPSKQAEDQLKAMGTSSAEFRKKIREDGLISALSELKDLTNKYGEEAMARVYPNIRGLLGVFDLMGANAKSNKEVFKELENATGTLDDAFEAASSTLDFKWNQAVGQVQATAITFFDTLKTALIPILETVTGVLANVAENFKNLSPGIQKAIITTAGIIGIIGPVLTALGTAVGAIGTLFTVFGTVISAVGGVLAGLSAPIIAIIAIVAGLAIAAVAVISKFYSFNDIIKILQNGFSSFLNILKTVGDFFASVFGPIVEVLKENFSKFDVSPIVESFNNMKDSAGPLIELLKALGTVIGVILLTAIGLIIGIVNGLANAFSNIIGLVLNVVGVVTSLIGILISLFTLDFDMFISSVTSLWENIKGIFVNAVMAIFNFVKGLVDGIIAFFKGLYDTLVGHSIVPDMINAIIKWFKDMPGKILNYVSSLVTNTINRFNNLKSLLINIVVLLLSSLISYFNNIRTSIVNIITSLVNNAVNTFRNIISKFVNVINSIKNSVTNGFNSIKNAIMKVVNGINLANAGKKIIQGLINGINAMVGKVKNAAGNVAKSVRDYFPFSPAKEGPLRDLNKINFHDSITESINKAKDKIKLPAQKLSGEIFKSLENNSLNNLALGSTQGNTKNVNIGSMNFNGISNILDIMKRMESTIKRYGGRF